MICLNTLALKLTPKGSTRSADTFLRGWAICHLPERNSKSRAFRSLSVARVTTELNKFYWRQRQTHSRRRHDGCGHYHCLLLDHFVFLQRNRKRSVIDRSGAVAPKREAPRACGFAVESPAPTSRTVTGDRSARHECGRHRRFALADQSVVLVVQLRWILVRPGHCASCLLVRVVGSPEIVVPAVSVSRTGATCRRARIRVDIIFAVPRIRRASRQVALARSGWETRSGICRARGAETDHK